MARNENNENKNVWIYHEQQVSLLCGQHCLNNLIQMSLYDVSDLAEIAQELDKRERDYMLEGGENSTDLIKYLAQDSQNVDESGNFSIEVIKMALENINIELIPWFPRKKGYSDDDPCLESGFIVNHSSHWFTIRKVGNIWWNLNSFHSKPEKISNFFLSAFLAQLVNEGYSVFIARGQSLLTDNSPSHDAPNWHCMSNNSNPTPASQAPPTAYQGTAYRLGGESSAQTPSGSDQELTEEEQIALAMKLSMEPQEGPGKREREEETKREPMSEKERLREKRLAALSKSGL
jgi:ataxin-3